MVIEGNYTYLGEYCLMYRIAKSIYHISEINIILYVNKSSIKQRSVYLLKIKSNVNERLRLADVYNMACCLQQMAELD